jgi:hypothetical protein
MWRTLAAARRAAWGCSGECPRLARVIVTFFAGIGRGPGSERETPAGQPGASAVAKRRWPVRADRPGNAIDRNFSGAAALVYDADNAEPGVFPPAVS